MTMNTLLPESVLKETFGFSAFRSHQEGLVRGLLAGRDVFGVMPTGGGKSLCFQLPAVCVEGCAVVVSPLIALMKDQVDAARANGIRAACVNSAVSMEERKEAARAYGKGELDLLYVAPERLSVPGFLDKLRKCPGGQPAFFAIDEAHCLSEWGHDFRPDYLFLGKLKKEFPGVPMAAFTATATHQVAADIEKRLQLAEAVKVRASFDRTNLYYEVRAKKDWERQMVEFIKARDGECGIIYRTSRKSVEATAAMLRRNDIDAKPYHAGMENVDRSATQEAFLRDNCKVIVATVAFGMGIDKPDVRFVIHGDLPKNIEGYYQETGRAGRDGEPSHCLLLYSSGDVFKIRHFIDEIADEAERQRSLALLKAMENFGAVPQCRRKGLLGYFGEKLAEENCGGCDFCDGNFEMKDATRDAQMLLSAIARSGERFGAVHVCDIVCGANTARIREMGHDQLKTYGMGKDRPKAFWRSLMDSLMSEGIVAVPPGDFSIPGLTAGAWKIMKGEADFEMHQDKRAEPEKAGRSRAVVEENFDYDRGLFEHLRALRKRIADEKSVPPFVVASDRTLRQVTALMPDSREEFLKVHGIGQEKFEKFGPAFMEGLAEYLGDHPEVAEKKLSDLPSAATLVPVLNKPLSETYYATFDLVKKGLSPEEISKSRGIGLSTVETHIAKLIEEGEAIDPRGYVSEAEEERVRGLIEKLGAQALKPIFEAGEGKITYGQIRIVMGMMVAG
ncbi:MAG: ATP-dependent DNA helicase RecQ [Akkermansiaceae bacterium]|jgi:ATP-dependent DNA helicase RecQ